MTTLVRRTDPPDTARRTYVPFSVLTGLTALAVLLQGLWAGIFLEHDGKHMQRRAENLRCNS